MESRAGRCLFLLSFGKAKIYEGTSQPEATMTLAIIHNNGTLSLVYKLISSLAHPTLPQWPTKISSYKNYLICLLILLQGLMCS